mgnify:CR=1 FL=1
MAQNYYDWTGVLNLKQVTGVIQALFGGADLDAAYPGNGQAYIAEMSEGSCLRWDEIHEALVELAESYGLEVTEDARECIKACAVLLAEHFGHSSEKVIEVLDGQVFDDDRPELTVLFELAQLFDDGHELTSVETEGAYHCSKPRLHEFGGNGLFIGKHVVVQRSSSSAIADGSGLELALREDDLDRAVQQLLLQVEGRLEEVTDEAVRATLRAGVAAALAKPNQYKPVLPSSVPVKHWASYEFDDLEPTHVMEVEDHRLQSGQLYLTAGQSEGDLDQLLSVTIEIGTNPLNGIDQVPCAHVHFDSDALAFSAFRVGNGIVLRPEVGVSFRYEASPSSSSEELVWVE